MNNKERVGCYVRVICIKVNNNWYIKEVKGTGINTYEIQEEVIKKTKSTLKKLNINQ